MNNNNNNSYVNKTVSKYSAGGPARRNQQDVWIRTQARRSSLARLSLQRKTLPAYLIYCSENGAEQRFDVTKSVLTIGRNYDRDIVLQCPLISKDHASIEKDEHGYLIIDHDSINGILVNGQAIQVAAYLQDGDEIQIGSVALQFFNEVEINGGDWQSMAQSHPVLAASFETSHKNGPSPLGINSASDPITSTTTTTTTSITSPTSPVAAPNVHKRKTNYAPNHPSNSAATGSTQNTTGPSSSSSRTSVYGRQLRQSMALSDSGTSRTSADDTRSISDKHLSLVAILQPEKLTEDSITVRAELDGRPSVDDFMPAEKITDGETLRNDYEKLRLAYELSKMGITEINRLLEKTLDLMFSVLPVDRGVVLLVDGKTGMLTTDKVKLREGKGVENKEILLSYTILKKVFSSKKCLVITDVLEDPLFGKAESIARGKIRSVICVPLVSRDEVHGILHLDSQDRINAFSEKDLALVKAIANQTAIALENCKLVKDVEKEVTIRENLGRFLPPHVVEKVISKGEEPVRKGGRQTTGTILFADIRGFTNMSEKSSPGEVVDLLNEFFERLVTIVFKYDGVLDKYIGDCLMADFGTLPEQQNDKPELRAICAALEFKQAINEMNEERERAGKTPITLGIGLNSGSLVAGYIGSSQRLEYTCIGDVVNTASRICSVAVENQVLISESLFQVVEDEIEARFIGSQIFKGKSTETGLYEVASIKEQPLEQLQRRLSF